MSLRPLLYFAWLLLAICSLASCQHPDAESPSDGTAPETVGTVAGNPKKEAPEHLEDVPAELREEQQPTLFVLPAPSEVIEILGSQQARTMVQEELREPLPNFAALPRWQASLALGRTISDLLIVVPEASPEEINRYFINIREGLEALNIDDQRLDDLEKLSTQITNGTIEREELVTQLDRLRSRTIQEVGGEIDAPTAALIATGGWARATNAVSRVARQSGDLPETTDMLKLRLVVQTLINELSTVPEARPVLESLRAIVPITSEVRPSAPTHEELDVLIAETDEILSYTRES